MAIDTIEHIPTPKPPDRVLLSSIDSPSELNSVLENIYNYHAANASFQDQLYEILNSGALVRSFQVEELLAGTIGAGTITADEIYLYDDRFELDGALGQIRVLDDNGYAMVTMGRFAGGTDWGITVRDGNNDLVFQALSNAGVSIDGGYIANATINGAAIIGGTLSGTAITGGTITGTQISASTITNSNISDVNGNKLVANSVEHGKISSVNASTISVGTLTADGSPVAINITGSGALVCSSGGDIILRASASGDSNVLLFQTSGGTNKAVFTYSTSLDRMTLQTQNGADMTLSMGDVGNIYVTSTTGDLDISGNAGARGDFLEITMDDFELDCTTIDIGVSTSQSVDVNADFISHLTVNADNTYDLGVLNTAWRDAYVFSGVTTGDIRFGGGQGVVLTEPDKVWSTESVSDGLVMMKGLHDWTPIYWDKADGTRQTSGFSPPDVFPIVYQPDKANELYEDIVDELTDRYLSSGKKRPTHLFRRIKDHLHQWENEQSKMHRVIRVADMNSKRQELMEKIEGGEWTNQSSRLWHKNKIQGRMIAHKESIQTKRKQRLQ